MSKYGHPPWNAQRKHGGSLGFQCVVANICGGDAGLSNGINVKILGALPPFPIWEGVLATETGDPRMISGSDNMGEMFDGVTKSITECEQSCTVAFCIVAGDPKCKL